MEAREQRLLDAAIEVIGTGGMRQLTHRAVDAASALPVGSTSNRFRTREALLAGVLRRILEREIAASRKLAIDVRGTSVEAFASEIGTFLEELTKGGRVLTQARLAVFAEAGNEPALRHEIARAQRELTTWLAPLLAELGSSEPSRDARHLLALIDGLLGHQLATGASDLNPTTAVAALLHGLIDG